MRRAALRGARLTRFSKAVSSDAGRSRSLRRAESPALMLHSPHFLIVVATLCWAGNITLGKLATQGLVPPFALSFWRWALALIILLPFAWPGLRRVVRML